MQFEGLFVSYLCAKIFEILRHLRAPSIISRRGPLDAQPSQNLGEFVLRKNAQSPTGVLGKSFSLFIIFRPSGAVLFCCFR